MTATAATTAEPMITRLLPLPPPPDGAEGETLYGGGVLGPWYDGVGVW